MNLIPIDAAELRARLNQGVIKFAFKKLNGNLRTAEGTTEMKTIPIKDHPIGQREPTEKAVTFYDLEKGEWRRVSSSQEIFIDDN